MPFMIFMVIDGCKIDSSQSIPTGNQIDSALAGIVLEGGQDIFFEMLDKYDRNSEAGGQCQGFLFYIFLILYGCYSWHLQDRLEPWEIMLISHFFPVNLGEPPSGPKGYDFSAGISHPAMFASRRISVLNFQGWVISQWFHYMTISHNHHHEILLGTETTYRDHRMCRWPWSGHSRERPRAWNSIWCWAKGPRLGQKSSFNVV